MILAWDAITDFAGPLFVGVVLAVVGWALNRKNKKATDAAAERVLSQNSTEHALNALRLERIEGKVDEAVDGVNSMGLWIANHEKQHVIEASRRKPTDGTSGP